MHRAEGCKDGVKAHITESTSPISMPKGPITRSRAKKLQQEMIKHLQGLINAAKEEFQGNVNVGSKPHVLFNIVQVYFECNELNECNGLIKEGLAE